MKRTVLLADHPADLKALGGAFPIATTRDYVDRPADFPLRGLRVINLSRRHAYQTLGYYASLLAEARDHKVIPTVETALDLASRQGHARALPELEAALARDLRKNPGPAPEMIWCLLGETVDPRFTTFGRLLFDWFRAPILRVRLTAPAAPGQPVRIARIQIRPFHRLDHDLRTRFAEVLTAQSKGVWRSPRERATARYALAVLHDPEERLPPTSSSSLRHFARVAARLGVSAEPIRRRELSRLAEYDALFIRETTSIRNHTYRFAQRARAEGMPVIDDPVSMIRCTNKVYLWERLRLAGLPCPPTMALRRETPLERVADTLGLPLVVKVPDGSFSRGVKRATDMAALRDVCARLFGESDLLLAQAYLPTAFDWRIGVLGGQPLFACQYMMARNHWQIVDHRPNGRAVEGGFATFAIEDAPAEVIDIAVRAARLIGDGFYGVDLKQLASGVAVIEINDNPNLEHGVEDAVGRDAVWEAIVRWFVDRLRR